MGDWRKIVLLSLGHILYWTMLLQILWPLPCTLQWVLLWICICQKRIFHVFSGVHQKHVGDDWDVISKAAVPCLCKKMLLQDFHSPLHTHYDHATHLEQYWESFLPLLINRYLQQSVNSEFLRSRHLIIKLILLLFGFWKGKNDKKLHKICVQLAGMGGFDCGFQNFRYILSVHLTHI